MTPGCHCWSCWSHVLGNAGTAPTQPVCACTSLRLVLACGCSHGVFCAAGWEFGPDVASGSGLAPAQARWIWTCCLFGVLRGHGLTLTAAVCWCWVCGLHVLASTGTAWAQPGCGGSSQLVLLTCGCCHGVFWAVRMESGPDAASGSSLAPARARWTWSSCFFPVLQSHGMMLMAAACWCCGCGSHVLGSVGTASALPDCGCCSQLGFSPAVFCATCRESGSDGCSRFGFAVGQAQGRWSGCCPQALGSCGMALMASVCCCWGWWSPVLEVPESAPMLLGWWCWDQQALS